MLTATKARPALQVARTNSSIHVGIAPSRAASFLASGDIFDSPERLIFDKDPTSDAPSSRQYYPSHFRPPADHAKARVAASEAVPTAQTHKHLAYQIPVQAQDQAQGHAQTMQARQLSTLARHHAAFEGSAMMFDKPARPRHALLVTSRHSHTRSASSSASLNANAAAAAADMKDHVPPPPLPDTVVYKDPACLPRKVLVQVRRSADVRFSTLPSNYIFKGSDGSPSAIMGTVAALVGLGMAYELHGTNQNTRSSPKNIFSYSRSRENVA